MILTPDRSLSVIGHMIERHAAQRPDVVCAAFDDGSTWSWVEAQAEFYGAAASLAALGVRRGDRVLLLLPNGADYLRVWWGTTALGAVMVPVHTAYRGEMLRHICADAGSRLIVVDPTLSVRLDELGLGALPATLRRVTPESLRKRSSERPPGDPVEPWDVAAINYTSGTTGPAKGVITPHLQTYFGGRDTFGAAAGLTQDDRWMVDLPLFHVAAQQITVAALSVGASIAVRPLFDGRDYWSSIRAAGATFSLLAGSMGEFLLSQPSQAGDHGHGLRTIVAAPLLPDYPGFLKRFGIAEMVTAFGSTETGAPTIGYSRDGLPEGSCGKSRDGVEVRLVDEHDCPVDNDHAGEMVLRTAQPWELNLGYHGNPAATATAWRNGWFHTGDVFRRDSHANFYFVDRITDALRRRGENISSFQVEFAVTQHEAVDQAACVAYPGHHGEDDVKVFVVAAAGGIPDFAELLEFLSSRLAHFALPRYFELIDALPMTTTRRVRKAELRELGNSDRTWDREAHGITVNGKQGLVRVRHRN